MLMRYEAWAPQREFLEAGLCKNPEHIAVGTGGARGGGKSTATGALHILAAMQYPRIRTLILRKGTEDVIHNYRDQMLHFAKEIGVRDAFRYMEGKNYFRCLNGSICRLGFINQEKDYGKYLGHEYGLISLTEASDHYEKAWSDMGASNRAGLSDYTPRITLDTNPGGIGNEWIKTRFVDPKTRWPRYKWIPSFIWDCPSTLIKNPNYVSDNLAKLPKWQMKQWLFGRFDALAGQYFVIPPYLIRESLPQQIMPVDHPDKLEIPRWASWWGGVDYGDAKPFAVMYLAKWKELFTNIEHCHFVAEIYEANLDPDQQADRVREMEKTLRERGLLHGQVTYYADPSVGRKVAAEREDQSRTIAKMWKNHGFYTKPAVSNNRIGGWKLMKMLYKHRVLTIDPSCKAFLSESFNAVANGAPGPPIDEDLKQGPHIPDHALDGGRYVLLSVYPKGYREPPMASNMPVNPRLPQAAR